MAFYHGIKTNEQATALSTPAYVSTGITFAIGTAPVHQADGAANQLVFANNYSEAVAALGYSDDWDSFTLCEVMQTHFRLYGVSPVIFVNVLDPATHKTNVASEEYTLVDGRVSLPETAIRTSVVVKGTSSGSALVEGTDYTSFYSKGTSSGTSQPYFSRRL